MYSVSVKTDTFFFFCIKGYHVITFFPFTSFWNEMNMRPHLRYPLVDGLSIPWSLCILNQYVRFCKLAMIQVKFSVFLPTITSCLFIWIQICIWWKGFFSQTRRIYLIGWKVISSIFNHLLKAFFNHSIGFGHFSHSNSVT